MAHSGHEGNALRHRWSFLSANMSFVSLASFVPSLIVVQVSEQHVLGDGLGQGSHGLVVLWDDLWTPEGRGRKKAITCITAKRDGNTVQVNT